jgi:hypothetical protein
MEALSMPLCPGVFPSRQPSSELASMHRPTTAVRRNGVCATTVSPGAAFSGKTKERDSFTLQPGKPLTLRYSIFVSDR